MEAEVLMRSQQRILWENLPEVHLQAVCQSASERGVDSPNAIPLLGSTIRLLLSVHLLNIGRTEEAIKTGTWIGIQATGVTLTAHRGVALEAQPEEGALQGITEGEGALLGFQMGTADVSEKKAGARAQGVVALAGALERGSQLAKTLNPGSGQRDPPSKEDPSLLQNHSALLPQPLHPDREVWLAMPIDEHSSIWFLVTCTSFFCCNFHMLVGYVTTTILCCFTSCGHLLNSN